MQYDPLSCVMTFGSMLQTFFRPTLLLAVSINGAHPYIHCFFTFGTLFNKLHDRQHFIIK